MVEDVIGVPTLSNPYLVLINGPNLNRLGIRKPEIYGGQSLQGVVNDVREIAERFHAEVKAMQSNHEGEIIDFLQEYGPSASGIIINPGAFGHTSYALRDCLEDIARPTLEVHISNVHRREPFRHHLVLSSVVMGQIVGLGTDGYRMAAEYLLSHSIQVDMEGHG